MGTTRRVNTSVQPSILSYIENIYHQNAAMLPITDLPFLKSICWQGEAPSVDGLTDGEVLQIYERNWRYRGVIADLSEAEKRMLLALAKKHRSWLLSELER